MPAWYYIIIVAAIFMGAATIIEKYALKKEHATAYTAAFTVMAVVASLPLLPFADFNFGIWTWVSVYLVSIIGTLIYLLVAKVYRHGNISIASAVTSSMPSLFVVLLGFGFIGEVLSPFQYLSVGVLIVTTYIFLTRYNKDPTDSKGKGIKYIDKLLFASLVIAIGYVASKYLLNSGITPITYVLLSQVFIAINMIIYMAVKFGGINEISSNIKQNAMPLAVIAILTVAYRVPLYLAISLTKASLAVPLLNSIFIVVTVMVGGLLFKEGSLLKKFALSAILVAAAYFLVL